MTRDIQVNGEAMVYVKGATNSGIGSLSELGLASDSIRISPVFRLKEVNADAWGEAPFEMQFMLAFANITMTLVHFDTSVLDFCITESMGGAVSAGRMPRAGARLGNNVARFAAGNHFIGLNIAAPVGSPWRFYTAFLTNNPLEYPVGTERSLVTLNWRAIPYAADPWNGGLGASGTYLWDRVLDT